MTTEASNMPFDPTLILPRLRLGRLFAGQRQRWADEGPP